MDKSQRRLKVYFDKLDQDGDGIIVLKDLADDTQNPKDGLSREVRQKLLKDNDEEKQLNYQDFVDLVHQNVGDSTANMPTAALKWLQKSASSYTKVVTAPRNVSSYETVDGEEFIQEYNCRPPPIFIFLISLVEIAVFVYYGIELGGITATGPVPVNSPLIYDPYRRYQAWRYLTYMFIHAGYLHIINNLAIQVALGIPLEMVHKWWRVGIVYISGVVAGSLWTSVMDPTTYLAGASGGVYAIITAHLASIILNWSEMLFPVIQLVAFAVIMITDVSVAVYSRYSGDSEGNRTAYVDHLAGALAGILVGIGFLRNLEVRPWETKLWWSSMIVFGIMIFIAFIWNVAFPDYFLPSK